MEAKLIPLRARDGSVRAFAIVDAADFEWLNQWPWCFAVGRYAQRRQEDRERVYMHRVILGLNPGDGLEADHINGITLDNRRANLRAVTHGANAQNVMISRVDATSPHRGVSWDGTRSKWKAQATRDGRNVFVGRFDTEQEAADAASAYRRRHMPHAIEEAVA